MIYFNTFFQFDDKKYFKNLVKMSEKEKTKYKEWKKLLCSQLQQQSEKAKPGCVFSFFLPTSSRAKQGTTKKDMTCCNQKIGARIKDEDLVTREAPLLCLLETLCSRLVAFLQLTISIACRSGSPLEQMFTPFWALHLKFFRYHSQITC